MQLGEMMSTDQTSRPLSLRESAGAVGPKTPIGLLLQVAVGLGRLPSVSFRTGAEENFQCSQLQARGSKDHDAHA